MQENMIQILIPKDLRSEIPPVTPATATMFTPRL